MKANEIREKVSKAYSKAIKAVTPSCCGPQSCCTPESPMAIAELGTYGQDEIKAHQAAASSSFGCGNPLAFSDVKKGETVLDLGSGAGFDLLIASEKVGPTGKVIGVDMTEAMIDKARQNIKAAGVENIEVRYGLIEELPVETASVDWVISNCVINLSPEKPAVFSEIARVLKPDGRMRISDIVVEELPAELREHQGLYNSCIGGAVSEEEYLAGLAAAGLTEIKVEERFVYDAAQIKAIFADQQAGLIDLFDDLPEQERQETIARLITAAAGKVWSAKISAKKPL
jgi:SAM-dependent methyltransferase